MESQNKFLVEPTECISAEELIKSKYFLRWIKIILKKIEIYNQNYIFWLFKSLSKWDVLSDIDKDNLYQFVIDPKVEKLWQKLLFHLKNIPFKLKSKFDWNNQRNNFKEFLSEIFSNNWIKKIQKHIFDVAKITNKILD